MITHGCMMLLVLALPTAPPPAAASGASKATTSAKKPAAKPVDALVQKVQAYYARMSYYSADFVQTYTKVALSQK